MNKYKAKGLDSFEDDKAAYYNRICRERKDMTICIAAEYGAGEDSGIIFCTDWLASTPLGGSETSHKQHFLPLDWYALGAGGESDIFSLVSLLRQELRGVDSINETNAQSLIRGAIQKRKNQKADEYISSKFGISYKEFVEIGKTKFPEEIFRTIFAEVSRIEIGASLIIAGFNNLGFPLICETGEDGVHIRDGFATIGEGSYLATSVLRQREYHGTEEMSKAIYLIYEAKKYAERVGSVGKHTLLRVLKKGESNPKKVSSAGISFLASEFVKYGPKPVLSISFEDSFLE